MFKTKRTIFAWLFGAAWFSTCAYLVMGPISEPDSSRRLSAQEGSVSRSRTLRNARVPAIPVARDSANAPNQEYDKNAGSSDQKKKSRLGWLKKLSPKNLLGRKKRLRNSSERNRVQHAIRTVNFDEVEHSSSPNGIAHADHNEPFPMPREMQDMNLIGQTPEEAHAKSWGCVSCHKDSHDPHYKDSFFLGCTDCHGGNANTKMKEIAHIHPRFPDAWPKSANPVRAYALLNHENPNFIRFNNPGDLRVAHISCGTIGCHPKETLQVKKSMMTHGCMLWGSALYNNGAVPSKWSRYGESYSMYGAPQRMQTVPRPTQWETDWKGILPFLEPLPRFQTTHPGNILRIFERGGRFIIELGIPERGEEPGRPRTRLSNRGIGTLNRTDPVFVGLAKTRLLDPTLNFPGTNDHAGDYRNGGCTSCHVIYANDRSLVTSGPYAKYGNRGKAAAETDSFVLSIDPTIPKDESGHPITHRFTTAIPTSQCLICHMHPGTTVLNSYAGLMWTDQETDGHILYGPSQAKPTSEQFVRAQMSNPSDIDVKSLLTDYEFLHEVTKLNPQLKHTLADFHGHGWSFRAVFKKDREGRLLNHNGDVLENVTSTDKIMATKVPELVKEIYRDRNWSNPDEKELKRVYELEEALRKMQERTPVHMLDIHLEKGMHCVDCHFIQDSHGDTKVYGEVRAAIEITCTDCHGTITEIAPLRTSGPSAKGNIWKGMITDRSSDPAKKNAGRILSTMRTPFGKRRFETLPDGTIIQNSMVEPDLSWRVVQVRDTITPSHPDYNSLSALSKTVRFAKPEDKTDNMFAWGDIPKNPDDCAHAINRTNCIACHSSWNPSCFGCHLPQKADKKMPELHYEGDATKNYIAYCFQTLRDDVFMLGKDGNVTGRRFNPVRSACAVHVGSYNGNRESVYYQQQTISSEGMSGISFSTNVPHTVRGKGETKTCVDCHLSDDGDNNAIMAQLLMHGTNYLNFIGRYSWIASGEHGVWSPVVTERDEPQAVIGSTLHRDAFPDNYKKHLGHHKELQTAYEHPGNDISDNLLRPFTTNEVLNLQHRGEYLYAACGDAGLRIYDIAFTDNKAFAERYTTAPVSPLGQKFYVKTKGRCTDVASPTTIAPDPTRNNAHRPENYESLVPLMYAFIYATDTIEGLIMVDAGTLLDGNPNNNFVKADFVFNPNGILNGARNITIFGNHAWVSCDAGLVIVRLGEAGANDLSKLPEFLASIEVVNVIPDGEWLHHPTNVEFQFRYGFICDREGVKIIDVTDPENPIPVSTVELEHAQNIYVARTYAYVSAGESGLVILDVKNPSKPKIDQVFTAGGKINDLHDVKLGITYVSEFAYLADGHNGLHVVQLTSPNTPGNDGFAPRPTPHLVASFKIPHGGHALALSKGVDRDRAVDEAGNQIAVFGRVGARPLNLAEQQQLYLLPGTGNRAGQRSATPWTVRVPVRDYNIRDSRKREIDLHLKVEEFYGKSQLRNRQ